MKRPSKERPLIMDLRPGYREDPPKGISSEFIRSAEVLISELLLLHPHRVIFFIARDMEYHYDVSRVLLRNRPYLLNRIRIIEISRESLHSPLLKRYCEREIFRFSENVVLVDSGFNGNVIEAIRRKFPSMDVKGHLIYSESPKYCSSHAAMDVLNIPHDVASFARKEAVEVLVEQVPHYNPKCIGYEVHDGLVVPVHDKGQPSGGWEDMAQDIMRYIRYIVSRPEAESLWHRRLVMWSHLIELIRAGVQEPVCVSIDADSILREETTLQDEEKKGTQDYFSPATTLEPMSNYNEPSFVVVPRPGNRERSARTARYRVPFGFHDFLREIKERTEEGSLYVRLYSRNRSAEWLSSIIRFGRFRKGNLESYGIKEQCDHGSAVSKKTAIKTNYPLISDTRSTYETKRDWIYQQKQFNQLWKLIDTMQSVPIPSRYQIRRSIQDVLGTPGGRGFIRDILEGFPRRHFGIRFRGEVISLLWDCLLEHRMVASGATFA